MPPQQRGRTAGFHRATAGWSTSNLESYCRKRVLLHCALLCRLSIDASCSKVAMKVSRHPRAAAYVCVCACVCVAPPPRHIQRARAARAAAGGAA